jgi:hypothetical protein
MKVSFFPISFFCCSGLPVFHFLLKVKLQKIVSPAAGTNFIPEEEVEVV